ncbi:acetate--CoA ligase [Bartonella quintana]|uniref:Acetyl-coenzyme A synthetase n=4 Tax=Pseudomonadota TaxID=1224 RepID=ACSA_BARQU|nr:acetate--CoA ligase [Bartonella quintana]Q6FYL4.1 RecName: Full=Acetyl-coenzyme A synthetase; Short=AcCoA synthetase; Short=Acs; AltName: Full=Acetate--CoA ligase; AltName: Full=Acyl-activating enzyme [Bartonella quintana str. Toulouse]ETS12823.1 acetyl-coenzyme A synthetase [Bartonella quintana BQ2-D70]ETS14755.1 acetyl-coenzyme A synthetase [Bartonella quintana JK 73rel]ETS17188.1 acetyl-coenzyme A synthetase [Bartonella quintana JK 73]ETS17282.1 acetyl-coenzyme A synthetase [Bartonella q
MSEKIYPVPTDIKKNALINEETYQKWYRESINDPEAFWAKHGQRIEWFKPYTKVKNTSFNGDVSIQWYEDGITNVAYNCIDRHLKNSGNHIALIWEGNNPYHDKKITYNELYEHVCRFANILKNHGVKKGDRVTIYLPMIPEAAYAMLACARIGAIHSVIFAGFSSEAIADRIVDCKSTFIITADQGLRGGKLIKLKNNIDHAIDIAARRGVHVNQVLVIRRTSGTIDWVKGRDFWYHEEISHAKTDCPAEMMNAEDPLFILYTSGSTGKPKGVLHTTAGYLVYVSMTHQYVFDYHPGEIYWCTADIGWISGHSYLIYGPLCNGATTLMFEGIPTFPDQGRFWEIVDKHKVNTLYTAPTAIRALMGAGNSFVEHSKRTSLRLLGTVGEPINPEAWKWFYHTVGDNRCPILDTWWQTETGGHMITPLPGATQLKAGSATHPFFGVQLQIIDGEGNVLEGEAEGNLCIIDSWPGQMRTLYNDHERFIETYFSTYKGKYFTGDGCKRDNDGYYWITGRIDDILNVSGHRLGTAEIESALVSHPAISEAAVVGYPHPIKGQGIYSFVTLMEGITPSEELYKDLIQHVKKEIGSIALLDKIQFTPQLPKTRSGKIMRRILRKIAENDFDNLGDISTLAEPQVVDDLIANRQNTEATA